MIDFNASPEFIPSHLDVGINPHKQLASPQRAIKASLDEAFSKPLTTSDPRLGEGRRFAGDEVDIYRHQKDFTGIGFNPFDPSNYDKWINEETWGSAISKGLNIAGLNFSRQLKEWFTTYGREVSALANWDWSKLQADEMTALRQYYKQNQELNKYHVFATDEDKEAILFSKSSFSEMLGNAGFTLGTVGALSLEIVAGAALTYVTGGVGGGLAGAKIAQSAAKLGFRASAKRFVPELLKGMGTAMEPLSLSRIAANQAKFKSFTVSGNRTASKSLLGGFRSYKKSVEAIGKSQGFSNVAEKIMMNIPIVGTVYKTGATMALGAKAGVGGVRQAGVFLGGVKRLNQEFLLASTEASTEAIMGYGETLDYILNEYQSRHGKPPSVEEFEAIKVQASRSQSANYNTNLGILLISNSIRFRNLFSPRIGNRMVRNVLAEEGDNLLFRGIKMEAGKKVRGATLYDTSGMFGRLRVFNKVRRDYSLGQASRMLVRPVLKGFGRFELIEGFQEIAQEGSQDSWMLYYGNQYFDDRTSLKDAFGEGMGGMWSKEGLKIFTHGALTGTLVRFPVGLMQRSTAYIQKASVDKQYASDPENNPYNIQKKSRANAQSIIESINKDLFAPGVGKKQSIFHNFARQAKSGQGMEGAKSEREFQAYRMSSIIQGMMTAQRMNMTDSYLLMIEDAAYDANGNPLTNEQFQEAFGVDIKDQGFSNPQEFVQSVVKEVNQYSETIHSVRDKFTDFIDPESFSEQEREYIQIIRARQEEAIEFIAYHKILGDKAFEDANIVRSKLLSNEKLANSSFFAFTAITDSQEILGEIGNITQELKNSKESLSLTEDPKEKKRLEDRIDDQQKLLDKYSQWHSYFNAKGVKDKNYFKGEYKQTIKEDGQEYDVYDDKSPQVRELFREILNLQNKLKENKTEFSTAEVEGMFSDVLDYMNLKSDSKKYLNAYDQLSNPTDYKNMIKNMTDGYVKYWAFDSIDKALLLLQVTAGEGNYNALMKKFNEFSQLKTSNEQLMFLVKNPEMMEFMNKVSELKEKLKTTKLYKQVFAEALREDFGVNDAKVYSENTFKLLLLAKFISVENSVNKEQAIKDLELGETLSEQDLLVLGLKQYYKIELNDRENSLLNGNEKVVNSDKSNKEIVEEYVGIIEAYVKDQDTVTQQEKVETASEEKNERIDEFKEQLNYARTEGDIFNLRDSLALIQNLTKEERFELSLAIEDRKKELGIKDEEIKQSEVVEETEVATPKTETESTSFQIEQISEESLGNFEVKEIDGSFYVVDTDTNVKIESTKGTSIEASSKKLGSYIKFRQALDAFLEDSKKIEDAYNTELSATEVSEAFVIFKQMFKADKKGHKSLYDYTKSKEGKEALKLSVEKVIANSKAEEIITDKQEVKEEVQVQIKKESTINEAQTEASIKVDASKSYKETSEKKISAEAFLENTKNIFNNIC